MITIVESKSYRPLPRGVRCTCVPTLDFFIPAEEGEPNSDWLALRRLLQLVCTVPCTSAASLEGQNMDNIIARYEDYLIHTKHASANTV